MHTLTLAAVLSRGGSLQAHAKPRGLADGGQPKISEISHKSGTCELLASFIQFQ